MLLKLRRSSREPVKDGPPEYSVNGRTAVITGAASGIGRAMAIRLAQHGCPVAIADHDEAGLAETAGRIGTPVLSRTLDVRDREAQVAFAADVKSWAPQPLGLVFNNAGVQVMNGVTDLAVEDDEWVVEINLYGVMQGVRAFLPLLLEQNSGYIANTSSSFGLIGFPNQSAYCASKFAVRGYTEALRQELRETNVRVACVHPGAVKTNIVANARYRSDFHGHFSDAAAAATFFDAFAKTTPERAAEIIHAGLEAGKARIRVGGDAIYFDLLARFAPTRYYEIMELVQKLPRRG